MEKVSAIPEPTSVMQQTIAAIRAPLRNPGRKKREEILNFSMEAILSILELEKGIEY